MKKSIAIILVILVLISCDLSTSIIPTEDTEDMVATVNSLMTEFPTIENQPTKKPISQPTSQPTLLAPNPSLQTKDSGTAMSTSMAGTPQVNLATEASGTVQATRSLTSTPTITPTFIPDDPRNSMGAYSWVDSFENGNNWPKDSDNFTSVLFENGTMKLTALADTDGWRLTYPSIENFYLEASFQTTDCEKTDHFGIIFRVPDISTANQGYFYGIQCDGKYFIRVFTENVMTSIVYPKANPAILTEDMAVNRLGIKADDDKLTLYVNGVLVKEITDTHFQRGGFGIFVGSDVVQNLTVIVDEIAYWSLP
jgi:hypothetical protein